MPGVVPPESPPVTGGTGLDVPPHPLTAVSRNTKTSIPTSDCHLRRRTGRTKNSKTAASVSPPTPSIRRIPPYAAEAVVAAVLIERVAVAGEDPAIDAVWSIEQVGIFFAPSGLVVRMHARETAPINPLLGVMVTVEVEILPALIVVKGLKLIPNVGVGGGVVTDCTL